MEENYRLLFLKKDIYQKLLHLLLKESTTFCLVDSMIDNNADFDEDGFLVELPCSKEALKPYYVNRKKVKKWPGTIKNSKKAELHTYKTCKNSIDYLKNFNSFFDIEDQIDISFFYKESCIFYTISHEELCYIKNDLLKKINL